MWKHLLSRVNAVTTFQRIVCEDGFKESVVAKPFRNAILVIPADDEEFAHLLHAVNRAEKTVEESRFLRQASSIDALKKTWIQR